MARILSIAGDEMSSPDVRTLIANDRCALSPSRTESLSVTLGKIVVKKALLELARGSKATLWWWGAAPDAGGGDVVYLLGDGETAWISEPFSERLLRDCAHSESARVEIRRHVEALVERLTSARVKPVPSVTQASELASPSG